MNTIALSFFTIRLLFANIPFLIRISFSRNPVSPSLVTSLGLLMIGLSALLINTQSNQRWAQALHSYMGEVSAYEAKVRQNQLAVVQEKLLLQPTHRDLLLEAATLACADQLTDQCLRYFKQAQALDPNHPAVQAAQQQFTVLQ